MVFALSGARLIRDAYRPQAADHQDRFLPFPLHGRCRREHRIVDFIDALQWPAMLVTVAASWLVASQKKHRRALGFWAFLLSNVLWVVWGWANRAYALVVLQFALAILNIRGANKNDPDRKTGDAAGHAP